MESADFMKINSAFLLRTIRMDKISNVPLPDLQLFKIRKIMQNSLKIFVYGDGSFKRMINSYKYDAYKIFKISY